MRKSLTLDLLVTSVSDIWISTRILKKASDDIYQYCLLKGFLRTKLSLHGISWKLTLRMPFDRWGLEMTS